MRKLPEPRRASREAVGHVTLLDDEGVVIGTASKPLVHTRDTPLHLAFSCHLFDGSGHVLVTRRALGKQTWAGVWTNSFCGHPRPEENLEDAVRRHAVADLGVGVTALRKVIPSYQYRAVDANGLVEDEIRPVFIAVIDGDLSPDPTEVLDWAWSEPDLLVAAVMAAPYAFSPWMREQLALLLSLERIQDPG